MQEISDFDETKNLKFTEGEFLVKKVMSWEGVRREFGLRYL